MSWFWCILVNNSPVHLRVAVVSAFGNGNYLIPAGLSQWVQFFPGPKTLTAFDSSNGALLAHYSISVTGPRQFAVIRGSGSGPMVYNWQETAVTGTPPSP